MLNGKTVTESINKILERYTNIDYIGIRVAFTMVAPHIHGWAFYSIYANPNMQYVQMFPFCSFRTHAYFINNKKTLYIPKHSSDYEFDMSAKDQLYSSKYNMFRIHEHDHGTFSVIHNGIYMNFLGLQGNNKLIESSQEGYNLILDENMRSHWNQAHINSIKTNFFNPHFNL